MPWPRTNPNWESNITKLLKTTTKFKLRGLSAPMRTKHAVTRGWCQHREKPIGGKICLRIHLHKTSYSCPRQTMEQIPESPGLENPPSKRAACLWQSEYGLNMICERGRLSFPGLKHPYEFDAQAHAHRSTIYLFARPFQALPVSLIFEKFSTKHDKALFS